MNKYLDNIEKQDWVGLDLFHDMGEHQFVIFACGFERENLRLLIVDLLPHEKDPQEYQTHVDNLFNYIKQVGNDTVIDDLGMITLKFPEIKNINYIDVSVKNPLLRKLGTDYTYSCNGESAKAFCYSKAFEENTLNGELNTDLPVINPRGIERLLTTLFCEKLGNDYRKAFMDYQDKLQREIIDDRSMELYASLKSKEESEMFPPPIFYGTELANRDKMVDSYGKMDDHEYSKHRLRIIEEWRNGGEDSDSEENI